MAKPQNNTIVILLFFISCFNLINAQSNIEENSNNKSYLTLNLLTETNALNPRWRVGYIRVLNAKWKIGLDAGFGNRSVSFSDFGGAIEKKYQLWEIRPELYYIINPKRETKKYFSLELFYINHKDVFSNGHYYPGNGELLSYDKADYHREKYGFNLKYGFIIYSRTRLGFNIYTGLGLRIRTNTFSNITNPASAYFGPEYGIIGIDNYKNVAGSFVGLNYSFGFKLYYTLK